MSCSDPSNDWASGQAHDDAVTRCKTQQTGCARCAAPAGDLTGRREFAWLGGLGGRVRCAACAPARCNFEDFLAIKTRNSIFER